MTRRPFKTATCNELLDTFYARLRHVSVEKLVFPVLGNEMYTI